ncbi:MAG: hypothetical protein LUE12_00380 [Ruminococcus sp.]|nr:hypothetical protein [Ruminococcus sp.]
MIFKRIAALACTLAAASVFAVSASAENYATAGIAWMIKDEWEHRNAVGLEALNEMETDQITCHHEDVNITGNGDYTVLFSGWCPTNENLQFDVGTLGLSTDLDVDAYPDCVITLTDCTIDGVTYTFNEQPEFEEDGDYHILKIKNAYGVNADTTPEMDVKQWNTTDPITINFSVSGLPEDKIEDNEDEVIVIDYVSSASDEEESAEDESAEESVEESSADESTAASDTDSVEESDTESSSSLSLLTISLIALAAVVVIVVIIVIIIKTGKKKS